MDLLLARFAFGVLLPIIVLVVIVLAWAVLRRRPAEAASGQRLAALEEQVRGLLYRVWTLEQAARAGSPPPVPAPAASPVTGPEVVSAAPPEMPPAPPPDVGPVPLPPPVEVPEMPAPVAAAGGLAPRPLSLEQRIGARWTTWVGVVAILFGVAFFLKWSFENDLLGPGARVGLGLAAGFGLLLAGWVLRHRQDVPYLSEGLAGLGLGVLYLSIYGAHGVYRFVGPGAAFASMFAVTLLGALVSVLTNRQITAVLTVLGGLLTPVLLAAEPDERNLLAYLLVLDLLVLAIARFRTWPALGRVAWVGTALLAGAAFGRELESPHPLSRLALLSALFVLFLAVPLVRPMAERHRQSEIDLILVMANAAGYFWAVYATLEPWHPGAEGVYALALALVYRLISTDYAARVPGDEATVVVHEGVAWIFLTIAIPLALDGRWVTLAWAAQGVALLWSAARVETPVAACGGFLALLLAAARAVAGDRLGPGVVPVWNLAYLLHLLVVVGLVWGGALAPSARSTRLGRATGASLRDALWVVAALLLAVLLWREPPGLWPATLLTGELLAVGWLARVSTSGAWVAVAPILGAGLLVRVLGADDIEARIAGDSLLSAPLFSRIAACAALAVAGGWVARSPASARAAGLGRAMSGVAGVTLLFVLSVNWTRYQGRGGRWTTQVGLSVLWTLYAAAVLAWGFIRSRPPLRYAALALLGLTVFKVFLVDLAAVRTAYRILSFLVLGIVLLGISLLYQKQQRS